MDSDSYQGFTLSMSKAKAIALEVHGKLANHLWAFLSIDNTHSKNGSTGSATYLI